MDFTTFNSGFPFTFYGLERFFGLEITGDFLSGFGDGGGIG